MGGRSMTDVPSNTVVRNVGGETGRRPERFDVIVL
jgi:hypothetical protein